MEQYIQELLNDKTISVVQFNFSNSFSLTPITIDIFNTDTLTNTTLFSGSVDYNLFVRNLNFEPIYVYLFRLITTSQDQLFNEVQITKIDSNGNQLFYPEFPITKVDSFQEQGNIANIKIDGCVFDGRTYINQYSVNFEETVSLEVYYKQVNLNSASITYPLFFKPKIQLLEYLKIKNN